MSVLQTQRKAIALLITVFFIMLITIAIGLGLKYANDASKTMKGELFLFQSSIILDDVLNVLKKSPELEKIATATDLYMFLESTPVIPFESNGVSVLIEIKHARSKINPNSFITSQRKEIFKQFLVNKMINTEYATMLFDLMSGVKPDGGYETDIFNENPYLFRDYVVSQKHLQELGKIYTKKLHEDNLKNIDTEELFYASVDTNTSKDANASGYKIDVNYATPLAWELMLGCDETTALMLSESGEIYDKDNIKDFLSEDQFLSLQKFPYGFFEKYLYVTIKIQQQDIMSQIKFEYNIDLKKGSNFVFEV
ncbi:MAG: hypothetical protein H8E76_09000 [Helicobacteraceae bacterium]|mgnify:FL=1|nr:hypothetical protein [Candidatus Sulfurimonas ponti]